MSQTILKEANMKRINLIASVAVMALALAAGTATAENADKSERPDRPEMGMMSGQMHNKGMMGKAIIEKLSEKDQNSCKACFSAMEEYHKANHPKFENSKFGDAMSEFKKANKIDDDTKLSDEQKEKFHEFMKGKMQDKLKKSLAEFKKDAGIKADASLSDEQVLKFNEYLRDKMKDSRPERGEHKFGGKDRKDMPPRPPIDDDKDE